MKFLVPLTLAFALTRAHPTPEDNQAAVTGIDREARFIPGLFNGGGGGGFPGMFNGGGGGGFPGMFNGGGGGGFPNFFGGGAGPLGFNRFPIGNPVQANQNSAVQVGPAGTGIAHGTANALNHGLGGAQATQNSIGQGGAGSTVITDGSATAEGGGGGFRRARSSGDEGEVRESRFFPGMGGFGGMGGGFPFFGGGGGSPFYGGGRGGGPQSIQISNAQGGPFSDVRASGSSVANNGGFPRYPMYYRKKRAVVAPGPAPLDTISSAVQGAINDRVNQSINNVKNAQPSIAAGYVTSELA